MNSLATKRLNFWNNICEALSLVLGRNFFHWLNATSTLASISASTPICVSTIPVSGYTYTCERKWKCWLLSCVRLFAAPWNVARQAPVSVGFSRQESWSGLPFPSPEDLPDPGIEPESPALQADSLPSESAHKPRNAGVDCHPLLQGIFLTLGTGLHLLRLQVDSLPASHLGSPYPSLVSCWIFASILLHKPQIFALLSGCLKSQRNRLIFVHRWLLFSHL